MADRDLLYRVQVDARDTKKAARDVKQVFQRELSEIQIGGAGATGGRAGGGTGGLNLGMLTRGLGALGIGLGVRELGQMSVGMAELGTRVSRTREAFVLLSGGAENAAANIDAVKRATDGTITGMAAMNIANQANLLGFAKTSEQLERVARLATISGRVMGQDVTAQLENMQMAAANLSFVRLDTLGISATAVRDRFNELRATMDDTAAFTQAMIEVGEAGFEALGDSALTAASGIEILTARLRELKEEGAGAFGWVDDMARDVAISLGADDTARQLERIADRARELQQLGSGERFSLVDPAQAQAGAAALEKVLQQADLLKDAIKAGVPGARELQDRLLGLGEQAANSPGLSDEMIGSIDLASEAVGRLIMAWGMAQGAAGAAGEAMAQAARLSGAEIFRVQNAFAMTGAEVRMRGNQNLAPMRQLGERFTAEAQQEERDLIAGTLGHITDVLKNAEDERTRYARSAWDKAAAEVERKWGQAIGSLPGLPGAGRSPVTQEQMDLAAQGIPQRFVDSFLREVEDFLVNGVQREGINLEEIQSLVSRSAGIDAGALTNEQLAKMFSSEFTSGRLFALPDVQADIDRFLDPAAIEKGLQQFSAGEEGKAFVDRWLKERFGGDYDMGFMAQGMATGLTTALQGGDAGVNFAGPSLDAIRMQFQEEGALSGMGDVSRLMIDRLTVEWGDDVASAPWAIAIITAIKNQLAGEIEALRNQ